MKIPVKDSIDNGDIKRTDAIIAEMDLEDKRAINDLLYIANSDKMYINEKGYLQKLVDLLYNLGYYSYNESIFLTRKS